MSKSKKIAPEALKFNEDLHFLGTLCVHKHNYNNTGKSIRYKSRPNQCVVCAKTQRDRKKARDKNISNENQIAICPKCEKRHRYTSKIPYIGRGTPRVYCQSCHEQIATHESFSIGVTAASGF